jgi:serine/threonine-protein kinase
MRGLPVDRQTDIWAFGCVLYELLGGRPAFRGDTLSDTIVAILDREPDWQEVPDTTPPGIRRLLRRCLEKDVQRRLRDIGDARLELQEALQAERRESPPPVSTSPVQSIAVLPFVNASGDPEMEYLSDGLTESVILALSSVPRLRVMSRSAVFRYKGQSQEPLTAGRALGVETVLTGKVLLRGERLAIAAELVDVAHGWQLWGSQYRRQGADLLAVEEEIAREIYGALRSRLTPEQPAVLVRQYTENVAAYHLFLKGRFYAGKRTEDGLRKALQHFRQAIDLDPTYALAYMGLAQSYAPLLVYCHLAPRDAVPKMRAAAQHALDIDPGLTEARTALAGSRCFHDGDLERADRELREVVALNPTSRWAFQTLAEVLTVERRFAEAAIAAGRALEIDPLALNTNAFMAMAAYYSRRPDLAIDHGRKTVEMDETFFPGHFWLGMGHQLNGEFAEAAAALTTAAALSERSALMLASLGGVYAAWGKEEEARDILRQLDDLRRRRYVSQVFVAAILVGLREVERALDCLEQADEDRCYWRLYALTVDARFDSVRQEPRFVQLVQRVMTAGGTS